MRARRSGLPHKRLKQAQLARKEQWDQHARRAAERAAKLQADEEASNSQAVRDVNRYSEALAAIPFWLSAENARLSISDSYLRLVGITVRCMNDRSREAVLCWPNLDPSASAIAVFLALGDNGSTPPIKHDGLDSVAPPMGVRALVFPYARTAHRALRHLYADKDYVSRLHTIHQIRANKSGEHQAFADYHKTLARTKTLSGIALDGKTYDEFRHPCLDETLPSGPCLGLDGRSELLWRVRTKTDLRKISRSGKADDPASAKFYLFGIRASDRIPRSLEALSGALDVALLDLTQIGRNRLGPDWLSKIRSFLTELDRHVGPVATVALTDDPWTFDSLRFDGLSRTLGASTRHRPAPSSIVFAQRSDLVVSARETTPEYSLLLKQDVIGFSGEVEALLRRLRTDAKAAITLNDKVTAELLRRLAGTIRRCASLPGSREDFARYVEGEAFGGLVAADILSSYGVGSYLKELKTTLGPWAQYQNAELKDLCTNVSRVWDNTAQLTPMAPLLRDVVKRFMRVSSRTVVLFRNDMLADFAAYVLCRDEEVGELFAGRIEKDMLLLLDKGGLDDLASLPATQRNHIKTLIVVAPTRSQILSLLARSWLPDGLIVLADSDTLAGSARDATRLVGYPELNALATRMKVFAEKASQTVHRIGPTDIDYELVEDVTFPVSAVINLAGNVRPDQPTMRLTLSDGQTIIARPGTKLILQDRSRTVPMFTECEAKDVDVGDRVCVIGDAFLDMARPLLNITARAAEEIRDYHQLVLERFHRVPGSSIYDRLAHVVETMGLSDVTIQRASYWVDLDEQLDVPLHEVVPHAPRDRATFLAFMTALGVSEAISSRFWTWAVIAQRTSRVRAAMNFHDAYRTILIDNYASQAGNPERARDIRRLQAAAESFVGIIQEKKELRGHRDRT
jgi:hypothetical protein